MTDLSTKIRASLSTMSKYSIVLLIIFFISFAYRVLIPYESVFTGDGVIFGGADPWYHMRLVENLLQHFPHRIAFDPFTLFPFGQNVPWPPFFDLLLGSLIWVIGLGSPTQHTIETVSVYFPAILGALVTVPVYFIGRELFNRNVGLLAAALIAILPGQFLLRSLLGFTDHHVTEVLFSTTAALFLILAIKRAKGNDASFGHIRSRELGKIKKPLIYAMLAGFALGIYLLMWNGGLLFIFMIAAYTIIQYIIDHLRGKSTDYLCIIGMPMFLIVLIMVIPFLDLLSGILISEELVIVSLIVSILIFPVLSGISWLMASRNFKRAYYPMALVFIGAVGIALLYLIEPSLYHTVVARFRQIFSPSGTTLTIGEAQSLFSQDGFVILVSFFTTGILLALIALGQLIYTGIRKRTLQSTLTFLVIWSLIMLLAMLGQNRFAYYFAVNVALLAGYLCWQVLAWRHFQLREAIPKHEEGTRKFATSQEPQISLRKEPKIHLSSYLIARQIWDVTVATFMLFLIGHWKDRTLAATLGGQGVSIRAIRGYFKAGYVKVAGVAIIVFLIAFFPNFTIIMDKGIGTTNIAGPNEAWYSSLTWMRENTPDPFNDPDFYYELYERPPAGENYDYPESAYGVMNYWDNGHWITRIAHRIPSANPFQAGVQDTARFFVAQDESSANEILEKLGSKYTIIDHEVSTGKFSSVVAWAGESESQYYDTFYQDPTEGGSGYIQFIYPEYYLSMCSRLYNFGGQAVVPHNSTFVISYEEKSQTSGSDIKEITSIQSFETYEDAQEFMESHTDSNYSIGGFDAFTSPVPLKELENYKLIHQSDPEILTKKKAEPIPYVKIFEYLP